MSIFRFSVGSDAKSMAVPCVFAIGVVCWANFVKHCLHCQFFDFVLDNGERLAGEVNSWWKGLDLKKPILQAKTVDFKSAYKQFA